MPPVDTRAIVFILFVCVFHRHVGAIYILAANPNAVMGVGNGEKYAFVLNTGSTGQNNSGQHTCWSDVSIERVDAAGTKFFDTYEFTTR
ncbi:hypothetical protein ACHAXM_007097 [Skeletonema potamos]